MAYPAIGLAVMLGIAICAAVYIMFTDNDMHQHQYGNHRRIAGCDIHNSQVILRPRQTSKTKRSQKRKCDICSGLVNSSQASSECGHVYHRMCLRTRFTELYGSSSNGSLDRTANVPVPCILCYEPPNDTEDTKVCCICQDSLVSDFRTLVCKHVFHSACITRWQRTSKTCPYRCNI